MSDMEDIKNMSPRQLQSYCDSLCRKWKAKYSINKSALSKDYYKWW